MTKQGRAIVIGAGAGGLSASIDLARQGFDVTVLERSAHVGGKMRRETVAGAAMDAGPTVFTMRWVFDGLLSGTGVYLDKLLTLKRADILARHAWMQGGRLDLYADIHKSAAAIGEFAGSYDANGYLRFVQDSGKVFDTLKDTFIVNQRPTQMDILKRVGPLNMTSFMGTIKPFETYWSRLRSYFADPRLVQLFGRYATYVGSSPFLTPATIMLIAHVEQEGVWLVEGGMRAVAEGLQSVAEQMGATFQFGTRVSQILTERGRVSGVELANGDHIPADTVVFNGDISALGSGLLGRHVQKAGRTTAAKDRSLSAVTWCIHGKTSGFPLEFHNVFFANDYASEFDAIFDRKTITRNPTVYVCAQDRGSGQNVVGAERIFLLANAPADGDQNSWNENDQRHLQQRVFNVLNTCGLQLEPDDLECRITTPADFNGRFPATGGALYGQASHGAMTTLARAGAKTKIPGLYIAGGSVHPGAGVPMATLSGRLAAAQVLNDWRS